MTKKYLIAVDSGHGMETPGKRTPKLLNDLYIDGKKIKSKGDIIHEKEFNKPTAEYLIKELERCGFDTINVSPGTKDITLQSRVSKANKAGADFYISKHYNALGDCSKFQNTVKGIVTIYNDGSKKGKEAAKLIQDELIKAHGSFSFGARADKDVSGFSLYVLSHTNMPAVLTESGFMDYENEAKKMLDSDFQKSDAKATCKAICKYFDVDYIEETQQYLRVLKTVNIHKTPDFESASIYGRVGPGTSLTIVKKIKRQGTDMYLTKAGYYITASSKYVEVFEK